MSAENVPGVRDALDQARQLLSSVQSPDQGAGAAERVLECAFRLLESLYATVDSGRSVTLSSADSTVVKAILELVVRRGIYPHLSPGVGIPLEKRFGEKAAASAAAALKEHVSGEGAGSSADLRQSIAAPTSLLQSAELLAGLMLDNPQKQSVALLDMDVNSTGLQPSVSPGNTEESLTPATQFPAAALQQLVVFHHLPDLCAAFLQLSVSGKDEWKELATERMNEMVRALPVAHMDEALLTLIRQTRPEPPTWLKERAGRMLSKLLLREGGVAASMERLVGGIQEGNVKAYEHIAAHLAKVPKYITTTLAYYEAVCPQLPPLFLGALPGQEGGLQEGTSAARLVVNMHHTAIIMACKLASRDIKLCGTYLFIPLLKPLLQWGMQTQRDRKLEPGEKDEIPSSETSAGASSEEEIESALINAVIGTHLFFTAGHDGADHVQRFLLPHFEPISEALVSLKVLLEPLRSKQGSAGEACTGGPASTLDRLRAALFDIIEILHEGRPGLEIVPPTSVINAVKVQWPRHEGEIWVALISDG